MHMHTTMHTYASMHLYPYPAHIFSLSCSCTYEHIHCTLHTPIHTYAINAPLPHHHSFSLPYSCTCDHTLSHAHAYICINAPVNGIYKQSTCEEVLFGQNYL